MDTALARNTGQVDHPANYPFQHNRGISTARAIGALPVKPLHGAQSNHVNQDGIVIDRQRIIITDRRYPAARHNLGTINVLDRMFTGVCRRCYSDLAGRQRLQTLISAPSLVTG